MSGSNSHALTPLLTIGAVGLLSHAAQAEEPEPLDEEFLDYLLQLEGDDEDWTLFDSQPSDTAATKATDAKPAPTKETVVTAKAPERKSTQVAVPNTEVKR